MRLITVLALGLGLAAAGSHSERVQAATNTVPATAQFSDRVDDHIKSDGLGAYVDGLAGVVSHFFTTPGEQDWVQYHTSQKPGRTVNLMPVLADGGTGPAGLPSTLLLSGEKPIINFDDLGACGGTCVLDSAVFDTSVGRFRFDGLGGSCHVVAVSGAAGTSWTVSTSEGCAAARLIRTRQVKGKTVEDTYGPYELPFEVVVSLK